MKVVYKYPLDPGETTTLTLPKWAKVVDVAMQGSSITLWVQHQQPFEGQPTETRVFQVFGTGHQIPDFAGHVGTVHDGPFVWHVYQVAPWVEQP